MKRMSEFIVGALLTLPLIGCPNEAGPDTGVTALTIRNQSFSDLLDVQWQGVTFRANSVENSILIGHSVTKDVDAGSGYIFFKRKSNPAFARTREALTLEKNKSQEFFFTDNTLIVEANNPDNTGTLKDMITTVVFYDNAEGEIQQYAERKGAGYYTGLSDLPHYGESGSKSSSYYYFHPPYSGSKSIALGGDSSGAKLRLILNLAGEAKLSFWFANKESNTGNNGGAVSLDGAQKAVWKGNYSWAYHEYPLEAGSHEIVWTKDGKNDGWSSSYLSLDNILVVYIE
jgi:hypothetical protein